MMRHAGAFDAAEGELVAQWLSARQGEVHSKFLCLQDDFSHMHSRVASSPRSPDRMLGINGAANTANNGGRTSFSRPESEVEQEATVSHNILSLFGSSAFMTELIHLGFTSGFAHHVERRVSAGLGKSSQTKQHRRGGQEAPQPGTAYC